jgi:GT2 family glycosyltransferase
LPGHLQRCFDYLESHPEMSIVIDQLYHATDDVNERWLAEYPYQDTVQHQLLFINAHFPSNVVLLRKDIFEQIGGAFDEELLISEDTDLASRILESGIQIPIIEGAGSAVRNHNTGRLTGGKGTIKFAYLRTAKAVARYPYPASWIRQRRAIIQYRLVRLNLADKRYLSAVGHLIAALFLNPMPAIKMVLGKWK